VIATSPSAAPAPAKVAIVRGEMHPAVAATGIERRHPGGRGAGPIDVEVAPAETLALMGPNGAGKTTLLRMLATVDRPQRGSVSWWGSPRRGRARRRLGLALDSAVEDAGLSGRQSTHFWCRQWVDDPSVARELVDLSLRRFGLGAVADEAVGGYSYGMRRRLALAQALVHQPDLALLDEPTAGLDPAGALALRELLAERCGQGRATVVASNDPAFVESVAARVALLVDGRLVRCAPPVELLAGGDATRVVEVTMAPLDLATLRGVAGVIRARQLDGERAVLELRPGTSLAGIVAAADSVPGRLRDLSVRDPDLRDRFAALTGAELVTAARREPQGRR
jgi:ABC-2 type transport system ATP-binding protein